MKEQKKTVPHDDLDDEIKEVIEAYNRLLKRDMDKCEKAMQEEKSSLQKSGNRR